VLAAALQLLADTEGRDFVVAALGSIMACIGVAQSLQSSRRDRERRLVDEVESRIESRFRLPAHAAILSCLSQIDACSMAQVDQYDELIDRGTLSADHADVRAGELAALRKMMRSIDGLRSQLQAAAAAIQPRDTSLEFQVGQWMNALEEVAVQETRAVWLRCRANMTTRRAGAPLWCRQSAHEETQRCLQSILNAVSGYRRSRASD